VLYVGGNYFFAMAPLVAAFEQQHSEFKGRIYWETLPPGVLEKQIEAGETVTSGNMTWTTKPDAYLAGLKKVQSLIDRGLLTAPPFHARPTPLRSWCRPEIPAASRLSPIWRGPTFMS
jgi:molybdate transport system substrate-binding protein